MTTAARSDTRPIGAGLISDDVHEWARRTPDAVAMSYQGQEWTWAQWAQRIRRVSGALRAEGIGRRDRVAFLDKNHPACLEVTLGAADLGAATAVLNWRLAGDELRHVLLDSDPRVLFVGEELLPSFERVAGELTGIERVVVVGQDGGYERWLAAGSDEQVSGQATEEDTAVILYTSGTTGFPKGAMLTHRGLAAHTRNLQPSFPMSGADRNLVAMPLFHVGGSSYALIGFAEGAPTVLLREVTGAGLIQAAMSGCTHAFLVPAVLAALVQAGPDAMGPMARMKVIGYGASPAPLPVLRACLAAWPQTQFLQVYGMTELSGVVTTVPPAAHHDPARPERLASAGLPIPGVEMRVVDPVSWQDVEPGEPGELWFRTEQQMAGYLGRPDATAETITPDGWLRTGDLGRVDDGGFVFIEDRLKDMIITGGENVYSSEVERVIQEYPDVAEVAVIGVPDDAWGESVLAVVAPRPGTTIDPAALIAFCREHLAGYKCPKSVEFLDILPRNASGKLVKPDLRRPYWRGRDRSI